MATEKLKRHKPGTDHIPAEMIKAWGTTIRSEIHKLKSVSNKGKLPEDQKESIIVSIYKMCDETDCSNQRRITFISTIQNFFQHTTIEVNSIRRGNHSGSSMWISKQQVNY